MSAKGDYFGMGSKNVEIENFTLVGNYSFDGAENLVIRNARMLSKDAFWNSENVTVYDSFISGEIIFDNEDVNPEDTTITSEK